MRMIENGEVTLAAESFGQPTDPTILLIMGATASMLGWPDELCSKLADSGFFVIRFDHRDTGKSTTAPAGEAQYDVETLAKDALAVLDGYGVQRAHLLGMSLGGFIVQMLALEQPERVLSVTLIASEPLGWDGSPLPHISPQFLKHFAGFGSLDWSDPKAVTDFLVESERLCVGTGTAFDERRERARVSRVLARTDSPASMFNHGTVQTRDDWTGRFREIRQPVLVLHGTDDPILPVENGRAIADGIPGATLAILDGVGHELPLSQIPAMVEKITRHATKTKG